MKPRIWAFVAIALLLLVSCQAAPTVTPVPTRERSATPVASATEIPAATPLPSATPSPMPPQPPTLLDTSPQRGQELAVDAPIVLRFDQAMDQASVEAAWAIAPAVKGRLVWSGPSELQFVPEGTALQRDTAYQVTLGVGAKSAAGLALAESIALRFTTVGYLQVTDAYPLADSTDVATNSPIRVVFNRPVVPLVAVQEAKGLVQPLAFSPQVAGQGTWVNTSIYSFQPQEPLAPGTRYTVKVAASLKDLTGGILAQDYAWSFVTELPAVQSVLPEDKAPYADPSGSIRMAFNQPMDQASVASRFSLTDADQQAVSGRFTWEENSLVFQPGAPLKAGARYTARLEGGALARYGQAALKEPTEWRFTTAGTPRVIKLSIADGEKNVDLGQGIEITFSSPISDATFMEGLSITPTANIYTWWGYDQTVAQVSMYLRPSTVYTVTLGQDILGLYGQPLAPERRLRFTTAPYDPLVNVGSPDRVGTYNAYRPSVMYIQYRNVSRIDMALYSVPPEDVIALNGNNSWQLWDEYAPGRSRLLWSKSRKATAGLNATGIFSTTLALDAGKQLPAGFYWFEASAPEGPSTDRRLLIVSPWSILLKTSQQELLAWVIDLKSGEPLANVALDVYDAAGKKVSTTRTDAQGLASAAMPQQDTWEPISLVASQGKAVGLALKNWTSGISPWEFGLPMSYGEPAYRAHFYTERLIYRPDQTVHFKGILRQDEDGRYGLPPAAPVELVAYDGVGREFWRQTATLNDLGAFDGQLPLAADAPLGYYNLQAIYQQGTPQEYVFTTDFQVAEYRKPEFQVQVQVAQDDYVQGETIQASAEATYFFGGPVANANVSWQVMRSPYYFDRWQGKGYASFADYDYDLEMPTIDDFGGVVTQGEGRTDAQGRLTLSLPANISQQNQSQVFTIEVTVFDLNNQATSARSSATIHKGDFYIGLSTEQYVSKTGSPVQVTAFTVDTQGAPLPKQSLQVVVYQREWYSARVQGDNGIYYWTNEVRDTAVATQTVTTDASAQAPVSFTPKVGGTFKVVATGVDAHHNTVRSALFLWVSGGEWINWGQRNNDRLDLVSDKKSYRPGETAKVLVPSPYQGKTRALLTIERGGIIERRVLTLSSNSEQLEIPILPAYAPNVYVSIALVKGMDAPTDLPSFKMGYVMLTVSAEQQVLSVSITPDRTTHYQPRDTVTYDIAVKDFQGKPVRAELALQLVDLAVESLVGRPSQEILSTFYSQRNLGVLTSASLAVSIDRHNLEYPEEGKGGGGGGGGELLVREDFPDTAFWAPAVRTDAQGKAKATVKLPDSLTTWRLTAQGATADTLVGQATKDIVSTLDLMVRPVAPRFLVVGDQPILGAVVHNNTDQPVDATVSLQADGLTLASADQQVVIPAHGRTKLYWPATVTAVEQTQLRYRVTGAKLADAVNITLPVYHPITPEVVGTAGQVEEAVTEHVRLPQAIDRSAGELVVNLEPSLAASMEGGLDFLTSYPYQCVEQTVSRFLPNVVTFRALTNLGIGSAKLAAALPQQVAIALQRLYTLQNLDGGWGWWQGGASSPDLTAYVVQGMVEAQAADLAVDGTVLKSALAYLYQWLDQSEDKPQQLDQRANVLYALALANDGDLGRSVALFEERAKLSLFAKGYLALTLQALEPTEHARTDVLVNEFNQKLIMSAAGGHWEEAEQARWAMNTDLRTTAIILRALVQLEPDSPLLANVVRWLVSARQANHWGTTQENVWAILALTDYMVTTGELDAQYAYWLQVNGTEVASGEAKRDTLAQSVTAKVPVASLQPSGDNLVRIGRDAQKGKLYYSAYLRYYVPADEITALDRGIIVQRQYALADKPGVPIQKANVNDTIVVKLTLIAPRDLYFLVFEDPLPAGCEAIDSSLATSQSDASPVFRRTDVDNVADPYWWYWAYPWPTHTEVRDEKVALFADSLARGTYEYTYQVRCSLPGVFKVLPATAFEMYTPDVFGRSDGQLFEIKAAE